MLLPKTNAVRAALRQHTARAPRTSTRTQIWRPIARRGYASGGDHAPKKAGSDWPWLIGAVVVTLPSAGYILSQAPSGHDEHGEGHGGEGHEEEAGGEEGQEGGESSEGQQEGGDDAEQAGDGEEKQDEATGDQGEGQGGESKDDGSASEGSDSEDGEQQDTPPTSDDESSSSGPKSDKSGVRFKGPTSGDGKDDERLHIPDAKGGAKRRINSGYGNKLAPLDEANPSEDSTSDEPASSKPAGSRYSQSGKQEGVSNTDTKHSTDIANDPGKSKKGEGMPETAKAKGTVDPQRPQPEKEIGDSKAE